MLTTVLRALAADGVAVLVTGHEVPTLLDAADHITWCTSGTTYELGPPDIAIQHEAFRRDYLALMQQPVSGAPCNSALVPPRASLIALQGRLTASTSPLA